MIGRLGTGTATRARAAWHPGNAACIIGLAPINGRRTAIGASTCTLPDVGPERRGLEPNGFSSIAESGQARRIAMVAPTAADARDTMVMGESGLLSVCPPWNRPIYQPSLRRLTWPNGAIALTYSAEEPDRLRGPNFDAAWLDETAAWDRAQETFDMLSFASESAGTHASS